MQAKERMKESKTPKNQTLLFYYFIKSVKVENGKVGMPRTVPGKGSNLAKRQRSGYRWESER